MVDKVTSSSATFVPRETTWNGSFSSAQSGDRTGTITSTEIMNETGEILALAEKGDVEQQTLDYQGVVAFVNERFSRAKSARLQDEQRWMKAYTNYRGLNDNPTPYTSTEKSKVFIKITKTKVNAAFAQICDVLFAGNKFPLGA